MRYVLVHIKEEVGGRAVGVGDVEQVGAGLGGEGGGGGVRAARHEDEVVGGDGADGGDGGLDRLGPRGHGEVVGLVHDAKDDVGVVGVLRRERRPQRRELVVGGAALADDLAVPARVVVDVDDALGARREAARHEGVVAGEVGGVEVAADDAVGEVLPADGEAEHVEVVARRKVLHLRRAGARGDVVDTIDGALAVGVAAKVEAGDVDAGVRRVAARGAGRRRRPGGRGRGAGGGAGGRAGGQRRRRGGGGERGRGVRLAEGGG